MLMVIFGAGASYDSVPRLPVGTIDGARPPLAKGLFEATELAMEAMDTFFQCQAIIPDLQHHKESVEQTLQRFQEEDCPLRRQQLGAVRFYLQRLISRWQAAWQPHTRTGTNYQVLLSDLHLMRSPDEQVWLVTFNYDTLLEDALWRTLRLPMRGLGSYIGHEHYKVIKLHGLVDWAREVHSHVESLTEKQLAWELIDRVDLNITQNYVMPVSSPPGRSGRECPLFPAIAIPVERKNDFECPAEHLQALTACLPQVSHLLIIGWRAAEQHFLTLLKDGLPRCAPTSSPAAKTVWTKSQTD